MLRSEYATPVHDRDGIIHACGEDTAPLSVCCAPKNPGKSDHYFWASMLYGHELNWLTSPGVTIFLQRTTQHLTGVTCSSLAGCKATIQANLEALDPTDGGAFATWSNQAALLAFTRN